MTTTTAVMDGFPINRSFAAFSSSSTREAFPIVTTKKSNRLAPYTLVRHLVTVGNTTMQFLDQEATKRTAAATTTTSSSSDRCTPSDRLSPYISIQDDDGTFTTASNVPIFKQQVEEDEDDDETIDVDVNVEIDDDDLDQKPRARRPFP
ncbi:hypothetical protein IV203_002788 [Nitzschia inconspicua]|uniref:Uncharacterized protein n=1 Tax=Nitzschia inconspicua TaxID=303405 RepID=A0A9K3L224_9STRA|nr:hypothetical protein IV203_002788 [Nitzschia inconspicua]